MRRGRLTYEDAFHHVMNRGIKGEDIFKNPKDKDFFLNLIREKSKLLKIKIFSYCLLDNHYHIILQNSSGKMGEFIKRINSQYGIYYRKNRGGVGYVFQGRYKSTVIQEDSYLKMSILYLLLNPVRAGLVSDPHTYHCSSIHEIFSEKVKEKITDTDFVQELFGSRVSLDEGLNAWMNRNKKLPTECNRFGEFLGDTHFLPNVMKRFNRRKKEITRSDKLKAKRRIFDQYFKKVSQIIDEFEKKEGIKLTEIDLNTWKGKRLRGDLLVLLKDEGGLKYSEIIYLPLFEFVKYHSLGQLYKRAKARLVT